MTLRPLSLRSAATLIALSILIAGPACRSSAKPAGSRSGFRIGVSFPKELGPGPFDGRMLLILSDNDKREPRFQVSSRNDDAQPIFGIDVENLKPGEEAIFD